MRVPIPYGTVVGGSPSGRASNGAGPAVTAARSAALPADTLGAFDGGGATVGGAVGGAAGAAAGVGRSLDAVAALSAGAAATAVTASTVSTGAGAAGGPAAPVTVTAVSPSAA